MRRRFPVLTAAFLLAWLGAPARALESPPRQQKLDDAHGVLDYGLWNGRIDALYDLGDLGRDALGELEFAGEDADWQVRLTAVHFLGKIGLPAAPALGALALREPCPHVRLLAEMWLLRLGATGESLYRAAASPEDAEALARLPDRPLELMGKPLVIDAPDEMSPEFFNGGPDFRTCASSEHAGRLHLRRTDVADADDPASHEAVVTPDVPPRARAEPGGTEPEARRPKGTPESLPPGPPLPRREVEFVAAGPGRTTPEERMALPESAPRPGTAESLPRGPAAPAPAESSAAAAAPPASPQRPVPAAAVTAPGAPETFPAAPPAPPRADPEAAVAAFAADAGTGKPEADPVPALIRQLSDPEPRRRARAADELGKRGASAAKAVPALRRALLDGDRRVRASAALALGSAGGGRNGVTAELTRALRDKDEDVRFSAALALERLRVSH